MYYKPERERRFNCIIPVLVSKTVVDECICAVLNVNGHYNEPRDQVKGKDDSTFFICTFNVKCVL